MIIKEIAEKIKHKIEMRKYDDFSIEDYFRKNGASVGSGNRIMIRSLGEAPELVRIGNHCTITSDVAFITHDGGGWVFNDEIPDLQKFGTIVVNDNTFIGFRSIILPNTVIGPNAVIGSGSVVTKNVEPNTVVGGNPARRICSIEEYKEKITNIWKFQKPEGYLKNIKPGTAPRDIEFMKRVELKRLYAHLHMCLWNRDKKERA